MGFYLTVSEEKGVLWFSFPDGSKFEAKMDSPESAKLLFSKIVEGGKGKDAASKPKKECGSCAWWGFSFCGNKKSLAYKQKTDRNDSCSDWEEP